MEIEVIIPILLEYLKLGGLVLSAGMTIMVGLEILVFGIFEALRLLKI